MYMKVVTASFFLLLLAGCTVSGPCPTPSIDGMCGQGTLSSGTGSGIPLEYIIIGVLILIMITRKKD